MLKKGWKMKKKGRGTRGKRATLEFNGKGKKEMSSAKRKAVASRKV